jgi:N-acetylneuraminic acid mutarotase
MTFTPIRPALLRLRAAAGTMLSAVALTAVTPAHLAAQTVQWTPAAQAGPIARIENAMVWCDGRMVLFGGHDLNFNRLNDLWEYDTAARTWVNRTPSPVPAAWPQRRAGHAMACDPVGRRVIVFGGWTDNGNYLNGTLLNDTWEWSTVSKTWTNRTPAGTKPVPRRGAKMVYDAANSRIVMFGGSDFTAYFPNPFPGGTQENATWVWNLNARTWTPVATTASSAAGRAFPGRTYHGMVYNTANGRIWIYGGIGILPSNTTSAVDLTDIWELQGATWVDRTPAGAAPQGRGWAGVEFDGATNRMIAHSGWNSTTAADYPDTWAFNGSAWARLSLSGDPGATLGRDSHPLVFDPTRNRLVIFGGYGADVLEMNPAAGTIATVLVTTRPPEQDQHSMTYDWHRDRVVMLGGGSPETWELSPGSMTWTYSYVLGPNGRIGHAMAYEGARRKTILFGGRARTQGAVGATVFNDTWEWDANVKTWTRRTPATSPPARYDHAMAYDEARNRIVLFGGRNASGVPLGDTWEWDGTTWRSVASGPSARFGHAMAFDPARWNVVLFGGDRGSSLSGETWERDSVSGAWSLRASTGPAARVYPALSPSGAATGGVVLFGGGTSATTFLNDTWLWDGTWKRAAPTSAPPTPRQNAQLIFSRVLGRQVLYGGYDANGILGDLWSAALAEGGGVSGDVDGDAKAELALFRPNTGQWRFRYSTSNFASGPDLAFGLSTDKPVPGDYDGDGRMDVAVYRPSNGVWYVIFSSTGALAQLQWGMSSDVPVQDDYTGDGRTDLAVWRPSNGHWLIYDLSTATYTSRQWGISTDIPITGDFDGDGKADVTVFRPSNGYWFVFHSSTQTYVVYQWGVSTDIPVAADYTGDGRADLAVYRPANGVWYVYNLTTNTYGTHQWGVHSDVPVPKDYDGDGKADLAIWRPSTATWFIYYLGTGAMQSVAHGGSGHVPIQ